MRFLRFAVGLGVGCVTVDVGRPVGELGTAPVQSRFGFPVADPLTISTRVGVDHDPQDLEGLAGEASCKDYLGRTFPHCYDEHHGTDYILDGGFEAMDAGSVEVVAAFRGRVVETVDGNYDRCQGGINGVDCGGRELLPNYVVLEHPDGLTSRYWHLMKGSVSVEVDDEVRCGDVLGRVGSSGDSSMPHLHFQVEDVDSQWLDPYAGPFSQDESLWEDQGPDVGLPEAGCTSR